MKLFHFNNSFAPGIATEPFSLQNTEWRLRSRRCTQLKWQVMGQGMQARVEPSQVPHTHPSHKNFLKKQKLLGYETHFTRKEIISSTYSASSIKADSTPAGNSLSALGCSHLNISLAHTDSYVTSSFNRSRKNSIAEL